MKKSILLVALGVTDLLPVAHAFCDISTSVSCMNEDFQKISCCRWDDYQCLNRYRWCSNGIWGNFKYWRLFSPM